MVSKLTSFVISIWKVNNFHEKIIHVSIEKFSSFVTVRKYILNIEQEALELN